MNIEKAEQSKSGQSASVRGLPLLDFFKSPCNLAVLELMSKLFTIFRIFYYLYFWRQAQSLPAVKQRQHVCKPYA